MKLKPYKILYSDENCIPLLSSTGTLPGILRQSTTMYPAHVLNPFLFKGIMFRTLHELVGVLQSSHAVCQGTTYSVPDEFRGEENTILTACFC